MELALHEPGLGYYAAGARKLGAGGDFVTAPELSPLFGRTLARQIAQILEPGEAILEFGAGSGALAEVLVSELRDFEYQILETSPELKDRQQQRLGSRVQWLDRLPQKFSGVMLANEVVDAMPVHALAWTQAGILERGVCANESQLAWSDRVADGLVFSLAKDIRSTFRRRAVTKASSECSRACGCARLAACSSAVRSWSSTTASRRASISTRSARWARSPATTATTCMPIRSIFPGCRTSPRTSISARSRAPLPSPGWRCWATPARRSFLVNCGITELLAHEDPADAQRYLPAAAAAQRLLSPSEMGELFKVLAVGKGVDAPLIGFAQGDP
jgi:SAM-dependent MidA family methyltransferase